MARTATGILVGGGGVGTSSPPNVTLGDPVITKLTGRAIEMYQIAVPVNLPTDLGSLNSVIGFMDAPDSAVSTQPASPDARTDGDPNRADGTGMIVGPAEVASQIVPAFSPLPVGQPLMVTAGAQPMIVFQWQAPVIPTECRVYADSASTTVTNPLVQFGQPNATPSVSFTLQPIQAATSGAEYGPAALQGSGSVQNRIPNGGDQQYAFTETWGINIHDPRQSLVTGYQIVLESPDGTRSPLGTVLPNVTTFTSAWQAVPFTPESFKAWVVTVGTQGTNSIVDGVTPCFPFTVQRTNPGNGQEYANLVTGVTAVAKYSTHPGSGQKDLILTTGATVPTGDARWGGVVIHIIRGDGSDHDLSGIVNNFPGGVINLNEVLSPQPSAPEPCTVYILSVDTNNRINSYVPGTTPSFPITLQPISVAAPLLDVTGFSVAPSYTNKDANGVPALILTPTFTPPALSAWQSIVFAWEGPGTPGTTWQVLGYPAAGGAANAAIVEQLLTPATAGTYNFLAISRDVNGKDRDGNTPDPNSPPSGTPPFSVHIDPYPSGSSGQEFTSLVTSPTATLTYLVTKDGVESVVAKGTLAPPTSDPSYAGVKLVMRDHAGVLPDVILAYTGPTATAWTSQRLPIDQSSVTWDVYFVSVDKSGNENSIVGGVTPEVASLVIAAQTTGRMVGSRLDPSTLAAQLAINSNLLGVAPGTIGPTQITPNSITTGQLTTSEITIGGGGSKPIRIRGFDHSGTAFFWIGDDTANSGFVGAWFKTLYVGGTGPAGAPLVADASGNLTINASVIIGTVNTAAFATSAGSASTAGSATNALFAPVSGLTPGTMTVSGSAPAITVGNGSDHTVLNALGISGTSGSTQTFFLDCNGAGSLSLTDGSSTVFIGSTGLTLGMRVTSGGSSAALVATGVLVNGTQVVSTQVASVPVTLADVIAVIRHHGLSA